MTTPFKKAAVFAALALVLAGCSSATAETPVATELDPPLVANIPAATTAATDNSEYSANLTKCESIPTGAFSDWFYGDDVGMSRFASHSDKVAIGGTVMSPSGEWAVIAVNAITDTGTGITVLITPIPLEAIGETIQVGRQLDENLDPGYESPGALDIDADTRMLWGFDNYTSWRGDLQDDGKRVARAAVACVID